MYRKGELVEDYTEGSIYAREILDEGGNVICYVIEPSNAEELYPGNTQADNLVSHLNKQL